MVTYPGLPGPIVCDYLQPRAEPAPRVCARDRVPDRLSSRSARTPARTSTARSDRLMPDGDRPLPSLPLDRLADLDALRRSTFLSWRAVGSTRARSPVGDVGGRAVLVRPRLAPPTGAPRPTPQRPPLSHRRAAVHLRRCRCAARRDRLAEHRRHLGPPPLSAHSTLLGADIPIVEHLCGLERVPDALPVLRRSGEGAGVRDVPGPRLRGGLGRWPSTASLRPLAERTRAGSVADASAAGRVPARRG